ncbi:MAG: DUF86 domain-containing protein [Candidatus Omnitrophica bacterium]|nr:DUF86 domain-containing protein [Candidatus Omnitrophota bacterium]
MRDPRLYLDDMLEAANRVEKYVDGMTFGELRKDGLTVDAAVRNLEIIGEAAKNIPKHVKEKYRDVEWRKISGLRDVLAHEYFGVDLKVLWDVIKHKLPLLKRQVTKILRETKGT